MQVNSFNKDRIMKKNIKAFTFAETLISLTIVGVIAALTIPTLKNHSDEQKYISLTKKAFMEATNATHQLETKYGDAMFWDKSKIVQYYGSIFDKMPTNKDLTWQNSEIGNEELSDCTYNWITGDGFAWQIVTNSETENFIQIKVDVNSEQPPNIIGIDQHTFTAGSNEVSPSNLCTKYLINHSKMPWLQESMDNCPNL